MVSVYVEDKSLLLTESLDMVKAFGKQGAQIGYNPGGAISLLKSLEQPEVTTAALVHKPVQESIDALKSTLRYIQAAGGLVYTPTREVLLIFRKGKWDLPKGKLDEGEDLATCALREIEEETGANGLSIARPLTTTYHTYYEKGNHILKESHWFLVEAMKKVNLVPQTEEDISETRWVPLDELVGYQKNMHASVRDVISAGLDALSQQT